MNPAIGTRLAFPLIAALLLGSCGDSPAEPERPEGPAQIAYVVYRSASREELHLMNPDGTGRRHIAGTPRRVFAPSWSPDGRKLAFGGGEAVVTAIYTVNVDGTGLRQVAANGFAPSWSPDGRRIVYLARSSADPDKELIMSVSENGGTPRTLVSTPEEYRSFALTPDGRAFAYTNAEDMLCIRPISGGAATCPVRGIAHAWSPNGERLAFTASLDGQVGWDIYTMDSQGGSITRVTRSPLREWTASWAPDGRRLAVWRDGHGGSGHVIVTMNLDESDVQVLTDPAEFATSPRWGPGR